MDVAGSEEPLAPRVVHLLREIAARAGAACTPRGLTGTQSSSDVGQSWQASLGGGSAACGGSGSMEPALRYAIYVWHGLNVDQTDKSLVFAKADELDRKLRHGLGRQGSFIDIFKPAACQNVCQSPPPAEDHDVDMCLAAEKVRQSSNPLLIALLEGAEHGAVRSSRVGSRAAHFPRLADAVARSFGGVFGANSWMREQRRPQAPGDPCTTAAACPVLPPVSATTSSRAAGTQRSGSAALVPRLALGAVSSSLPSEANRYADTAAAASMEVEEASCGSAGRKRLRGPDTGRVAQSARGPATPSTAASASFAMSSAQSARREPASSTQLASSLGARVHGEGPAAMPKAAGVRPKGVMPALNLAALSGQRSITNRPDAPAMLNLEEINMSEEEMLNSYDPENEENNYHLPHHVYKQLQLNHFRQVCSEVVPGALFISSFQVASELESLRKHQITHIVNTAADVCDSCFPDHFSYITYYLKDTNNEDISLLFYRTLEWIQNAISSGGRVLVHCREGISRSATMVIAYLMWRFSLSFEAAHEMIRKVRPICNPNTGFTFQLLLLGKKLNGTSSCSTQSRDRPLLFRIAPHHPREPFLLLMPVEWSPSWPMVDPRFGWVVQRGPQLVLWIGSQVTDSAVVRDTVTKHAQRLEAFERCQPSVKVINEGEEPALWQVLGLASNADCGSLIAPRPAYDADFEVLQALAAPAVACSCEAPPLARPMHSAL
uniref:Protein-serine/threonine phosphatase n=1 Tax=Pyrodinium bahamense TaxID=73915 RepID=A0A7S0F950_9DINO